MGILPLFYFFPPQEVFSLVTSGESPQFSRFMQRLYAVSVIAAFINVAWIRYFLCNYACLFRFGTILFRRQGSTHVNYDQARSSDCERCNFCSVACPTQLKPIAIKAFDRCINCAECVDACNQLHQRRDDGLGLLTLTPLRASALTSFATKMGWHGLAFLAGCALMAFGLVNP
jgi:polyferredoxin